MHAQLHDFMTTPIFVDLQIWLFNLKTEEFLCKNYINIKARQPRLSCDLASNLIPFGCFKILKKGNSIFGKDLDFQLISKILKYHFPRVLKAADARLPSPCLNSEDTDNWGQTVLFTVL